MAMTEIAAHSGYRIEPAARRPKLLYRAVCTCGWRSQAVPTAGMAGSAWDLHVLEADG